MSYTLKQAAEAAGKSKPTILRAIQKGRISAKRDELGRWQIEPAELHRLYPPVVHGNGADSEDGTVRNTTVTHETSLLEARLEAAEEKMRLQDTVIEDLRVQRDKWQETAAQAQRLLERQRPAEVRRLTWAERLTGRLVGTGGDDASGAS